MKKSPSRRFHLPNFLPNFMFSEVLPRGGQSSVGAIDTPVGRPPRQEGLWEFLGRFWCRASHRDISWPVNGRYHCRECGRVYQTPW